MRALLDAYASGLNTYARRHPGEVKLARLFPANGEDIATGFALRSPFFFGLDQVLGALAGDKPLPPETAGPHPDYPDPAALPATGAGEGNQNGSNAFAVAPKRSADGWTRLVSNAHQPWRGPVAWYELVVHSGQGWNFAGATFPGVPFPVLGHNETLGWTNTVNRPDLTDVYKLTLNPAGDAYRYDGGWRPLARRRVWLPVKVWGPFVLPVPKTVARAVQGPVIENKAGAFAIRYAGADQIRMIEEYYRLTRARTYAEWDRALAIQGVPATNFIYADATGADCVRLQRGVSKPEAGLRLCPHPAGRHQPRLPAGHGALGGRAAQRGPAIGLSHQCQQYALSGGGYGVRDSCAAAAAGGGDRHHQSRHACAGADGSGPVDQRGGPGADKYDTGVSRLGWAGKWFADLGAVDPKGDRQLAAARALLARWDWNLDGRGPADALAALLMRAGQKWHYQRLAELNPRDELDKAAAYLQEHFGRIDVPLGTVLRLRQGNVDLPLDGGPEVLRAASTWDEDKDGRLAVKHGDSFVMFMTWDRQGRVRSRSIQPYGAATTRPDSPHYADQAPLFVRHQTKPVWFRPAELRANVERVYRP